MLTARFVGDLYPLLERLQRNPDVEICIDGARFVGRTTRIDWEQHAFDFNRRVHGEMRASVEFYLLPTGEAVQVVEKPKRARPAKAVEAPGLRAELAEARLKLEVERKRVADLTAERDGLRAELAKFNAPTPEGAARWSVLEVE